MGEQLKKFRVHVHTAPSPGLVFYEGYVDVHCQAAHEAFEAEVRKLGRSTFRDRSSKSGWRLDRIERL